VRVDPSESKTKIDSTAALLAATATCNQRKALSGLTQLSTKRLREMNEFCDLLQVRGIGPKMAALMRLSGVYDTHMLAAQTGDALEAKMKKANAIHKVSEILPGAAVLDGWIQQAATLAHKSSRKTPGKTSDKTPDKTQ